MGIETIIILGLVALKTSQQIEAGRSEAKAINALANAQAKAGIREGELAAKNKAQEVVLRAARQQSSFLTSGLTLAGTPMAAIQGTFATGLEDVNQILTNTGQSSRNIVAQAQIQANSIFNKSRSDALNTIIGGVGGASLGSFNIPGGGQLDLTGELQGINVPFTGSSSSFSSGGTIIPGTKPTRINF